MTNLAKKLDETISETSGVVREKRGAGLVVRTLRGDFDAKRAVSCLVDPEVGDLVLLATNDRAAWVLAILEREAGAATTLVSEGDVSLRVATGRFSVAARDGIDLASPRSVDVTAESMRVSASAFDVVADRFGVVAGAVKTIADTVDAIVTRASARLKRSYKHVEEVDQIRADQIDYSADKLMALRATNAVVAAEELVKIDGEQIHVG